MLPIFHQQLVLQNQNHIRRLRRNRKQLRTTANPFNYPNRRFVELYRLSKELVRTLINVVSPELRRPLIAGGVSKETRVFCALRFYATGGYQRGIGEEVGISLSQTAVHRAIHEVTQVIVLTMSADYIKFPSMVEERNRIKAAFMEKWHFPGAIGAIDCTHIAILKPTGDEHNFINRKGFHSLNCQLICDHNLVITNVFANYGGSTHDSFIWRHSIIKEYLQNVHNNGETVWLLGDSGYPLQPYLMTPFHNPPEGSPQSRFNQAHIAARNCVERCIGVLKMRFRCLAKERSLRYSPQFAAALLKTCAILHNLCVQGGVPIFEQDVDNEQPVPVEGIPANEPGELALEGQQVRNRLVEQYFM